MELSAAVQETVHYYEQDIEGRDQEAYLRRRRDSFADQKARLEDDLKIAERHLLAIDYLLSVRA